MSSRITTARPPSPVTAPKADAPSASTPVVAKKPTAIDSFAAPPPEAPVREIPLCGPIADAKMQISGMAWAGDTLVLMPQYLNYQGSTPRLFALERSEVLAHLDQKPGAPGLTPREIPVHPPNLDQHFEGFEGFEAIAFHGDRAYLLIESKVGEQMGGHLVSGTLGPNGLTLDLSTKRSLTADTAVKNMGFEALTVVGEQVLVWPEANGARLNQKHRAWAFGLDSLEPQGEVTVPTVEYRLTDSTPADADGRFWVANYHHPGDAGMVAAADAYEQLSGKGASHANAEQVERLLPMRRTSEGVVADGAPVWLQLERPGEGKGDGRNWEALAPLEGRGFLVMTDEFPRAMFGFVETTRVSE